MQFQNYFHYFIYRNWFITFLLFSNFLVTCLQSMYIKSNVQRIMLSVLKLNYKHYILMILLLSTLHWLPVRYRIDFKIAVLTYKLLSTGQPSCLACKITPYVSGRRLRSSESGTVKNCSTY